MSKNDPYPYYDQCQPKSSDEMRDSVRERYLKWTFFSGGVSTLKTFSEFIFSDILGNVYPTKEKGNIGYGLRARHKINAGSRVFMYGPSGDTKIDDHYFEEYGRSENISRTMGLTTSKYKTEELRQLFDQKDYGVVIPRAIKRKNAFAPTRTLTSSRLSSSMDMWRRSRRKEIGVSVSHWASIEHYR